MWERHGYNVIPATTIAAAKSLVSSQGRSLDLRLSDVVLPDGNGPELAEGLKRDYGERKVVFMSGHDPDKRSGYGSDFDSPDLMQKPFSPPALLERVGQQFNA